MKRFNLQEYRINPSRKAVTRDGHPVRIICTDHDNVIYPNRFGTFFVYIVNEFN